VGRDALIVSPDGRVSGCYLPREEWRAQGLDLDVGALAGGGGLCLDDTAVQRVRELVLAKPRCRECFCRWSCAGGCHVHETPPGCPEVYSDFCVQTRIITACSLLDEMGLGGRVEPLLADRAALDVLSLQESDRLVSWRDG
jgi:radical SAM protein with 4Fe4S-binding SPASM domain